MINGQVVLGVIPARGGSVRVLRKNLRHYKGKPLLQWAIEQAQESKYLDFLCVSSDDFEMLELARKLNVKALKRPEWLSTNRAMNEGVLIHTLYTWQWADIVVLLQPTSPNRTTEDIDACIEKIGLGTGCITFNSEGKRNGAVYAIKSEELVAMASFKPESFDKFILMPDSRSLDIDHEVDFGR